MNRHDRHCLHWIGSRVRIKPLDAYKSLCEMITKLLSTQMIVMECRKTRERFWIVFPPPLVPNPPPKRNLLFLSFRRL